MHPRNTEYQTVWKCPYPGKGWITQSKQHIKSIGSSDPPPPHTGPFQGVRLQVLEIKKIYQRIVTDVNLSVLKLVNRY